MKTNTDVRIDYIESFLKETHNKFPEIRFRLEFNPLISIYIIEVKPYSEFSDNNEYGELEYWFTEDFERRFPEYMIMFVSDESLTKVKNPVLSIGYKTYFVEFSEKITDDIIMNDISLKFKLLEQKHTSGTINANLENNEELGLAA